MIQLANIIKAAKSIVLSTHRHCDGDGLGAEMALFFALRKIGKKVQVINLDATPRKYRFLQPDHWIQYFDENPTIPNDVDLTLIFDTNDERLVEPLFSACTQQGAKVVFIDHHPILEQGPKPSAESVIDTLAASTGEMAFQLIQQLGIPLDRDIARCLYTSITFDTQLYRFIRNSPNSHLIAAELLRYDIDPEEVHRHLFGNQTVQKMAFLAKALGQIEYFGEGRVAVLKIRDADLAYYGLETDESRDLIDMIMTIETLEAGVIFREDLHDRRVYKVSLRSKGQLPVLGLAESLGGGGHMFAAGANYRGDFDELRDKVVQNLVGALPKPRLTGS
ncbi:MAG: bifunctional oligoribonuclease/PAP phosphatase NrnA [Bdellovibrionaceae bacterium]|nr:bifunctional oligoribonuclease/PAP phosphatase NrnA [Pseudobdellovibrionaceae bacterium]